MIVSTAFVLAVPDADATADWFIRHLGFEDRFRIPGMWAFVGQGACEIRLGSCPDQIPPDELGDHRYFAYVQVDALDPYLDRLRRAGALLAEPRDEPWGMREVPIRTPDGHRIMLSQAICLPG